MSSSIPKIFFFLVLFGMSFSGAAQTTSEGSVQTESVAKQWERFFVSANESVVWDNGKVGFLKVQAPNAGEKSFFFTHELTSVSITDEKGVRIGVSLFDDSRIRSLELPSGAKVSIAWMKSPSGEWVPEIVGCSQSRVHYTKTSSAAMEAGSCDDAIAAIAIAAGVCAVSPGSAGCWAATANAAYQTYKCYRETHPDIQVQSVRGMENRKLEKSVSGNRVPEFPFWRIVTGKEKFRIDS